MRLKNETLSGLFAFKTDVGKVRISNEDQVLAMTNKNGDALLLVCDGMGGMNKGDMASNIAKKIVSDEFAKKKKFHTRLGMNLWIRHTVHKANKEIYVLATSNEVYKDMGTTLTMAIVTPKYMICAQVGDSRLYILNNNVFEQFTEDQTYVGYLYRTGQISKEEMRTHPKRHMLMNALGINPIASVDVKFTKYNGQSFLLCSDGLYNNVLDVDIGSIVKGNDATNEKVNQLINLANANGGSDNIGVVLWEGNK